MDSRPDPTSDGLETLERDLRDYGLFVRGGFHPEPADKVPTMSGGGAAGTVLLVGNAGADLWNNFTEAVPDRSIKNPLDRWLDPALLEIAGRAGAEAVLPNRGPDFPPIQDWAMRAEAVHRSPIGILIHPDFGLWHVYRAAFLFAARLELPAPDRRPSPCDSCAKRPCLKVCPADAFGPDRFDARACVDHVAGPEGDNCRDRGCLARRACPVGRDHAYPREAGAFHMDAVVRAVRAGYGLRKPDTS